MEKGKGIQSEKKVLEEKHAMLEEKHATLEGKLAMLEAQLSEARAFQRCSPIADGRLESRIFSSCVRGDRGSLEEGG